jgi:hypothetical protein
MRATEFLIENWIDANDEVAIAELIKHHCAPFLSYQMDKPFYRGTRQYIESALTQFDTPVGRKPKDLPRAAHEYCDAWFLRHFGHRYRSNAVFTTGNKPTAAQYGTPYIFIPIGHFDICWSTSVEDLYNTVDSYVESIGKDYSYIRDDPQILDNALLDYKTGDLSNAAYSGNEVMFACESYFLLDSKMLGDFYNSLFINTQ